MEFWRTTTLQNPASQTTKPTVYFPQGAVNGYAEYLSSFLSQIGEPSLLEAAQNTHALHYRLECLSAQLGYLLSVRLSLNPDGTGKIAAIRAAGNPWTFRRTEQTVSVEDVKQFLQLMEKVDFWSMPDTKPQDPDPRRRTYSIDLDTYVFEGVRDSKYHVVHRQGPIRDPFTEMVRYLTRNLARLDGAGNPL